jgi:hypothetical protein
MPRWKICGAWLLLAMPVAGCSEARPQPAGEARATGVVAASQFDAASAGTIRGSVRWSGPIPTVPPFEIRTLLLDNNPPQPRLVRDNPHAPRIDTATGGVGGAVVFLRGIDPKKARPWDHAKVCVENESRDMHILQGALASNVGFVRQGDAITMVSREPVFNVVRAKGAAFFSLMFPDPNQPLTRVLSNKGQVELSSGAGYYWMRGTLFVDDHPYYVRTDRHGEFELAQVPPGCYQIVCWLPNWNQAGQDRDPESGLVIRVEFHPPLELGHEVMVEAGGKTRLEFNLTATMFKPQ